MTYLKQFLLAIIVLLSVTACDKDGKEKNFPCYVSIDGDKYEIKVAATDGSSLYLLSALEVRKWELMAFFETYTATGDNDSPDDYIGDYSYFPNCDSYEEKKGTFESIQICQGCNWETETLDLNLGEGGCDGSDHPDSDGSLQVKKVGNEYEITFDFEFGTSHKVEGYYIGDLLIEQIEG